MRIQAFFPVLALGIAQLGAQAQEFRCKPGFLPDECAVFQRVEKERAEKEAAEAANSAKLNAEFEAEQKVKREERARKQAEWASEREKERAEREARYAEQKAVREQEERTAEREEAKRKSRCGADYRKPRVGMSLNRVKECVSDSLNEIAQTNTAQGVVTTYRTPDGYLRMIDGKVVQWGTF